MHDVSCLSIVLVYSAKNITAATLFIFNESLLTDAEPKKMFQQLLRCHYQFVGLPCVGLSFWITTLPVKRGKPYYLIVLLLPIAETEKNTCHNVLDLRSLRSHNWVFFFIWIQTSLSSLNKKQKQNKNKNKNKNKTKKQKQKKNWNCFQFSKRIILAYTQF